MKLESDPFVVADIASHVMDKIRPTASQRSVDVTAHVDDNVPPIVYGDQSHILQVLNNLMSNAVKFTPKGKAVRFTIGFDSPDTLVFVVADEGIGIAPDMQDAVFDAFRQADGSATRNYEGIGLGLALCKHVVDLMDGTITLESTVGEGSTFTVHIPVTVTKSR